jgi:hypothetical protein
LVSSFGGEGERKHSFKQHTFCCAQVEKELRDLRDRKRLWPMLSGLLLPPNNFPDHMKACWKQILGAIAALKPGGHFGAEFEFLISATWKLSGRKLKPPIIHGFLLETVPKLSPNYGGNY